MAAKLPKVTKLGELCETSNHDKIKEEVLTNPELDKVWELLNAFERICGQCCITLLENLNYESVQYLYFNRNYEWTNVPSTVFVKDSEGLKWKVPLAYQTVYSGLLDVLEVVAQKFPQALLEENGSESLLQFAIHKKPDCQNMVEYLLGLPQAHQLFRTVTGKGGKYSDLIMSVIHEDVYSFELFERIYEETIKLDEAKKQQELKQAVEIAVRTRKLKHLDTIIERNPDLLYAELKDGKTFSETLVEQFDIDYIQQLVKKFNLNLAKPLKDGSTVLNIVLKRNRMLPFSYTESQLVEELLKLEPKLAHVPCNSHGETLLSVAFRHQRKYLYHLLIEQYKVDVNVVDRYSGRLIDYAIARSDAELLVFLLKNGAQQVGLIINSNQPISNVGYLVVSLKNVINDVFSGETDFEMLVKVVELLHKIHGYHLKEIASESGLCLLKKFTKSENEVILLEKMIRLFDEYEIEDFDKTIETFLTMVLASDSGTSLEPYEKLFLFIKKEPRINLQYLEDPIDTYYNKAGFKSIKNYLQVSDFHKISAGKEVAPLKQMCRETIRKLVLENISAKGYGYQDRVMYAFESLPVPNRIISYLLYQS